MFLPEVSLPKVTLQKVTLQFIEYLKPQANRLLLTKKSKPKTFRARPVLGLVICSLFSATANAELILTAPPRETKEAGEKLYQPLADDLSKLLGKTVVYQHPGTWKNYQKRLQSDEYDIVFDGPHFAAWRMDSLNNEPLVRLPGNLRFVLVALADDNIRSEKDLLGRTICTLPSPNLGALTLYSMYPNPVVQPDFLMVTGGVPQVADKLLKGECQGAILRSSYYNKKLSQSDRAKTRVLKESAPIINQGITVSKRIDSLSRAKMILALTTPQSKKVTKPILDRFTNNAESFIPANKEEYVGQNLLHDNMLYGW